MEFKKGDRVRILRKAQAGARGWQNSWVPEMNAAVGKIGRVTFVDPDRKHDVEVDVRGIIGYGYPDFVLELVRTRAAKSKPKRK